MGGGGYEEIEGNDEAGALFLCLFCAEDLDIVRLCCHIDEDHPLEAKNGLGPLVCQMMPLVEASPVDSMARSASGYEFVFATAEHEKEVLEHFGFHEGRHDLYEYNQKDRRRG